VKRLSFLKRLGFLVLSAGLAFGVSASPISAPHSIALWRVVRGLCMTDMKVSGHPAPCLEVNPAGYAVLRDPQARTEILLVPTTRLIGIESPELQVPGEDVGMAINSAFGRSQDQLHIHVDCVLPDVKAALAAHAGEIGATWTPLSFALAGKYYRALRLDGDALAERDPFKLLAQGSPKARADMARQTLAVVGVRSNDGRPGFILLAATGDTPGNPDGAGEALLDHSCAVLEDSPVQAAANP